MMHVSSVNRGLRREATFLALVMATAMFTGCGGGEQAKNTAPKMPRNIYEKIFNQQMKVMQSGRPGTKPRTVPELVKAEGYSMDDWADAGKAYGIPDNISGKKVMTMGQDKPKTGPTKR